MRELAKKLNRNHAYITKSCKELKNKNILTEKIIGKNNVMHFNYENNQAINFVSYLLSLEKDIIPEWLTVIKYNLEKFNQHVDMTILFGSSTYSKKYNDIDVLLVYNKRKKKDMDLIKLEIRKISTISKPIRYTEITLEDINKNLEKLTMYNMLTNNIIIHGSEKYIEVIKNVTHR